MRDELGSPIYWPTGENISKYRGDFIGFQFGNETSDSLHIIRVSSSNRYNESLLPEFTDQSTTIIGGNQSLYFGSNYNLRQFAMDIAFDELTEEQFVHLTEVFSDTMPQRLIFDERPYKYYLAKVSTEPKFDYICFDEYITGYDEPQRIYKGEGTLDFVVYGTFAHSVYNYLEDYRNLRLGNPGYYEMIDQWERSTHMLESRKVNGTTYYDTYLQTVSGKGLFNVWNAGDRAADWTIDIDFSFAAVGDGKVIGTVPSFTLTFNGKQIKTRQIQIIGERENLPDGIRIDSSIYGIVGYKGEAKESTRQLFNKYMDIDDFSLILPRQEQTIYIEGNFNNSQIPEITYKHIYY